jgi:hypothetical protein
MGTAGRLNRKWCCEWIPPPHLPLTAATNDYHHPERLMPDGGLNSG